MLGYSTKVALINLVQSLQTGDSSGWDDQNETGKYCLLEMRLMTTAAYKGSQAEDANPETARLGMNRAIPPLIPC
jgi:hypothetical protein